MHRHKYFEDSKAEGVDFNQDLERTKVFLHFSMAMDEQRFYDSVKKDPKDPKSERITKGGGRTVLAFFTKGMRDFAECRFRADVLQMSRSKIWQIKSM
jgi:hypothetical protein